MPESRLAGLMSAMFGVLVVAACAKDVPTSGTPLTPEFSVGNPTCNGNWEGTYTGSGEFEEEIFGTITGPSNLFESAVIKSRDSETKSNQTSWYDSTNWINRGTCQASPYDGHNNDGTAHWGWYGIGHFVHTCDANGTQANNDTEHHRRFGDAFGNSDEAHCVRAGRFLIEFRAPGDDLSDPAAFARPIDFLEYDTGLPVPKIYQVPRQLTVAQQQPGTDVIVSYSTTSGTTPNPTIEISAVLPSDVTTAAWSEAPKVSGVAQMPANFTARVAVAGSTTNSTALVRYFWDWPSTSNRTGFANVATEMIGLARVNQWTQGTRKMLAHLVMPWDHPSMPFDETAVNYGDIDSLSINVYTPLTVTDIWTNDATPPTLVNENVSYGTSGQNGSGSNQYRWTWAPGDITDWTSSSTVAKTFTTSGLKTITVQKRDSNGYIYSYTEQIYIHVPLVSIITTNYVGGTQPKKNQNCTYYGGYSGGYGTVSYNWYKRPVGGSWTLLGSTTDITVSVLTAAFELKLTVADAYQSNSQTITVTPPGSGGATCVL